MPVKPQREKNVKDADLKKGQGGQHDYSGWDGSGQYDRGGFGLGQFIPPVSEDYPIPAKDVQQGKRRKVGK